MKGWIPEMKKLLALLMALMMCCTAMVFAEEAEEEADVPEVTMEVSFDAQTVVLGDMGLTMAIPAD